MNFHFCPNDSKNEKDFPFDGEVFFIFYFAFLTLLTRCFFTGFADGAVCSFVSAGATITFSSVSSSTCDFHSSDTLPDLARESDISATALKLARTPLPVFLYLTARSLPIPRFSASAAASIFAPRKINSQPASSLRSLISFFTVS